jgi:hypothetical protein
MQYARTEPEQNDYALAGRSIADPDASGSSVGLLNLFV